ncbi:MAG: YgeY family selenium metabolism-linked hydrolase [Candidatus Hydrothermae bacterium]|nr:YgeY family selenium metabolism-linked hydrolase [Candidatus Hydrothermae bacterium]
MSFLEKAEERRSLLIDLLLKFIAAKSLPGREGDMAERVKEALFKLGIDDITVDPMGNVIGTIGKGEKHLVFDGHMDVVDAGDLKAWEVDPFRGELIEGKIYGRGASDQKGGLASAIVALSLLKESGLPDDLRVSVVASVLEEPREGLAWRYIIEEDGIRPDFVVLTEPSSLRIMRGHLGRAEIEIEVRGRSAHGSMPEEGVNAIEKMVPILEEVLKLRERLREHPVLGKGKLTVSEVRSEAPSLCAVPDRASIHIDRRLTLGEDEEAAVHELRSLDAVRKAGALVRLVKDPIKSYTGLLYRKEPLYPPWLLEEDHPFLKAAKEAYRSVFNTEPVVDVWKFSTNGVATAGLHKIPSLGLGPGDPSLAHAPMEFCPVDDLVKATAFYAQLALEVSAI